MYFSLSCVVLLISFCNGLENNEYFMFVGVLASNRHAHGNELRNMHRKAVAPFNESVALRFFLAHADRKNETETDIIYTNFSGDYKDLTHQTLLIILYVAEHVKCKYLFKLDDDVAVAYPWMLSQLRNLNAKCPSCNYYAGHQMIKNANRGGKYYDAKYAEHAGIKEFVPYMAGPGYVLASNLLRVIKLQHDSIGLYSGYLEDLTVGIWVLGLNLTRVDWSRSWCGIFRAYQQNCTFWHTRQKLEMFEKALANMTST